MVAQGNHRTSFAGARALDGFGPLVVFHYPIRSLRQFESKVRNAGSGYAINRELTNKQGFHKRYWYQLLQEGRLSNDYTRGFFGRDKSRSAPRAGKLVEDRVLANRMRGARYGPPASTLHHPRARPDPFSPGLRGQSQLPGSACAALPLLRTGPWPNAGAVFQSV